MTAPFLAQFGQAFLLREKSGCYVIRGGSPKDRQDAKAWAISFLPPHLRAGIRN